MSKWVHYHQPWIDEGDEFMEGEKGIMVPAACGRWVYYDDTSCLAPTCPGCLKHGFVIRWGNDITVGFDVRPLPAIRKTGPFFGEQEIVRCLADQKYEPTPKVEQ